MTAADRTHENTDTYTHMCTLAASIFSPSFAAPFCFTSTLSTGSMCGVDSDMGWCIHFMARWQQCDSESGDDTGRRGKMYKYAGYSPSTKRKIAKRILPRGGGGASGDAAELSRLLASSIRDLEGKEARDREKYRSDALEFGMKLVEEERKRSDEEYSVLAKRIEFLTKELEESKRQHQMKSRECDELLEVAEELARGAAPGLDESTNSIASSLSSPQGRRNWLQSPNSSALSPDLGYAYGSPGAGGRYREEIADTGTPRGVQTKREGRERGCRACSMGSGESWGDIFSWMFKW